MLYSIHYWWFFFFQGNLWTKYLAHPKIWKPKPCLLMFASLITLDGFYLLLSTQLTVNLTPEWSDGSMFYPLSHIYTKTPFCCFETVENNARNHRRVVFDQLWANAEPTLNTAFSLTNVCAKWQIHCLLVSSTPLLSHKTLIYDRTKWVCGVFFVLQDNCWNWAIWTFSIICVCTITFKVSIPPLNCCFWWSSDWITLMKPLLCLNFIFSHQKAMLYQYTKFRFFHCGWKFATVASLK